MEVILEQSFLKPAKRLPLETKKKLSKLIGLLNINAYHPLLHTKKLTGSMAGFFSFRITRDWRVIFFFKARPRFMFWRLITAGIFIDKIEKGRVAYLADAHRSINPLPACRFFIPTLSPHPLLKRRGG